MAVEMKAVFRCVGGVTMAAELLKARFATVTGFNNVNFIDGESKYVS